MRKQLLILIIFSLLGLCGLLCGCANGADKDAVAKDDVLQMYLTSPLETVDPAYAHSESELLVASEVFEGLVRNDNDRIVPALASAWEVSADSLTYTFHLKVDALFHNGKKVTAGDFKFSWERVLRVGAPSSYIFAGIAGADAVISGQSKDLAGVTAPDDYTLVVRLAAPSGNFLQLLAMPGASVLDRTELVSQGLDYGRAGTYGQPYPLPSGTGPFRLAEWIGGQSLALGRFSDYYGDVPYCRRMELFFDLTIKDAATELLAGKYDIVQDLLPSQIPLTSDDEDFVRLVSPVRVFHYLALDSEQAPFNNIALRQAILAIVRSPAVVSAAREGYAVTPKDGICGYWDDLAADAYSLDYSADLVRQNLLAAGYPAGTALPSLKLCCGPGIENLKLANQAAFALKQFGFSVTVSQLSAKELRHAVKNGEAAMYIGDFVDKGGGLDAFFLEAVDPRWQGVIGAGPWSSLLSQAYAATGGSKQELFAQVEESLDQNAVLGLLYYKKTAMAVSRPWTGILIEKSGLLDFSAIR